MASTMPPATPYRHADLQAEVDVLPRRDLAETVDGPVAVESSVVMHDRESTPQKAIVSCLLDDGRRAWGSTTDSDAMTRFTTEETAGAPGHLDPLGAFRFTD